MHDQTAVRTGGLDDLPDRYPTVQFLVDSGYRGLANHHPDQVIAPPRKPSEDAPPEQIAAYQAVRKAQSSQRIPAEHAIATIKWWRTPQRFTGVSRCGAVDRHLAAVELVMGCQAGQAPAVGMRDGQRGPDPA